MINQFKDKYTWLSNFAPVYIYTKDGFYPSVEHAYQAQKSIDTNWKEICMNTDKSPGEIKKLSKKINLIKDWENNKVSIMKGLLREKFAQEPFKTRLLKTGDEVIIEGNYWNDQFWGVCLKTNKGKNVLGTLIMEIRSDLKKGATWTEKM